MSNKFSEQKKPKNTNNIYPNFLQNKQFNTNKLSFTNAFKNSNQKPKLSNGNINKKHNIKINNQEYQEKNINNYNNNNTENELNEEEETTNRINKEKEKNIKNININLEDEEVQTNKKLHNVDSFKNLEFLLPKKKN